MYPDYKQIKTEVPLGSWIWYLEAHLGSKRPTGLLQLDEEVFACQVDLFTLYHIFTLGILLHVHQTDCLDD